MAGVIEGMVEWDRIWSDGREMAGVSEGMVEWKRIWSDGRVYHWKARRTYCW